MDQSPASPPLNIPRRPRPRFQVPWDISDVALFFALFLLTGSLLGLLLAAGPVNDLGHSLVRGMSPEAQSAIGSLFVQTITYLLGIAVVLGLVVGRRHGDLSDLGWRMPHWKWVPIGLLCAAGAVVLLTLIGWLLEQIFPNARNSQIPTVQHDFGHLLSFAIPAVAVVAPIAEETFFRGFIYGYLRRHLNVPAAVVLSGLFFGAVHGELLILLPLAALGIGLALLYEYSGSLLPGVIVHAGFNLVEIVLILGP